MTAELMARNPVTNPTPAEVFRKAREHNITVMEARRVIIATNKVKAAAITIPTATRPIELPNYGLDQERNEVLIRKLRNLPAAFRDELLKGQTCPNVKPTAATKKLSTKSNSPGATASSTSGNLRES